VAKNKRIEKQTRRAEAERLRAEARRAERRRNFLAYGSAALIAVIILGLAIIPPLWKSAHDPAKKPIASFGVKASAAGCTDVKVTDTRRDHVTKPVTDYKNIPPASGPHFQNETSPDTSTTRYFPPDYKTVVETYVHNLEHGYLVVWYAPDLSKADLKNLKYIAARAAKDRTANKVKVVPWPKDRGTFPAGKKIAITAWGSEQTCDSVSGQAVGNFSKAHPVKDAPEPTSP
jgi:hypothetical protein